MWWQEWRKHTASVYNFDIAAWLFMIKTEPKWLQLPDNVWAYVNISYDYPGYEADKFAV